jgi:hypothetical protein
MRRTGLYAVLWAVFAAVTLAGGYTMLKACDLGLMPLFGASACAAAPSNKSLAAERERQDKLRADLHSAEIRLVQLPICPLPPKPKPLEQVKLPDPVKPPEPVEQPEPKKEEPKQEDVKTDEPPVEKFEIPKTLADLKGCWQSARGDIDMVLDNAEETPAGKARICYCFGSNGRGKAQFLYTDGDVCQAGLIARLSPDRVFMHHGRAACRKSRSQNPADITCSSDQSNQTSCEIQSLGKYRSRVTEQFIRVSDEHCKWGG